MWRHTVMHGRGSEGETGEWSGYPVPLTLHRNLVYPALLPLMRTTRLPVVDWTDALADFNGLVRCAERRNLVSARVPSHFTHSLRPLRKGDVTPSPKPEAGGAQIFTCLPLFNGIYSQLFSMCGGCLFHLEPDDVSESCLFVRAQINPYPTAFPYGNGMVLHFYQQRESSTTKTVRKVINKGLKTYV